MARIVLDGGLSDFLILSLYLILLTGLSSHLLTDWTVNAIFYGPALVLTHSQAALLDTSPKDRPVSTPVILHHNVHLSHFHI